MVGHTAELPNLSTFPTWWWGVFFPGYVLPIDIVSAKSIVDVKHGDSGVVIGYQVSEFTCNWLAECFIA